MTYRTLELDERLYRYLLGVSPPEPEVLRELRRETAGTEHPEMQIAPEQGAFLGLLVELVGAREVLELGTFTGYSALVMAGALPSDGRLLTCDVDRETTAIARRYWHRAGVDGRIELRLGPARETLDALLAAGREGSFDLAFIDADKTGYGAYYERVLRLLRPGGLVVVDNTLWSGKVADPAVTDADTEALRAFNRALQADRRVTLAVVPIGDGTTLARKR